MVPDDAARPSFLFESPATAIARSQQVYAHRTLNLADIEWIGFDADFALAVYDREPLARLFVGFLIARLQTRGYPDWLARIDPKTEFAFRGLLVDTQLGNLLKVDRERRIVKAFRGHRALSLATVQADYPGGVLRGSAHRFAPLESWSSIAQASVLAAIVEAMQQRQERVDPARLHADIVECGQDVLRDPKFLGEFERQLPKLCVPDVSLPTVLHKFRSAGKRLFLLTNSSFAHTHSVLSMQLDRALDEYPTWRNYFDRVVVAANIPTFFTGRSSFAERAPTGATDPRSKLGSGIDRAIVLEGGHRLELEKVLGCLPEKILYVSHAFDETAARAADEAGWRLAAIVPELEREIEAEDATTGLRAEMRSLHTRRSELEDQLRWHQARFKELEKSSPEQADLQAAHAQIALQQKRSVDRTRAHLRQLDQDSKDLQITIDSHFVSPFGSMLKAGPLASLWGAQLRDHACAYTSRVGNFAHYSPTHLFHAPEEVFAHQSK
jgi:HAD superfamily 5'-nucleotidase-like hydrolase